MNWLQRLRRLFERDDSDINVTTVTFGRKRPVDGNGNAEFVLTARRRAGQTTEEVMQALVQIGKRQLDSVINDEQYPERRER